MSDRAVHTAVVVGDVIARDIGCEARFLDAVALTRLGRALGARDAEWPEAVVAMPGAVGPDAFLLPRHAEGRGGYSLVACWCAVCTDAKLGSLRLHDLHQTATNQAVMSGEGLSLVGRPLWHNRHRTSAGYALLADAQLVEEEEEVGAIIATAVASQRPRPRTHRQ